MPSISPTPQAFSPSTPSLAGRTPAAAGERPWRCRRCERLLGVVRGAELHLRYKEAEHWVSGTCRHVCPRCRTTNVITVGGER